MTSYTKTMAVMIIGVLMNMARNQRKEALAFITESFGPDGRQAQGKEGK